jgi:hypothetical protein
MVTVMRPSRARVRKCNDTTPGARCPNCVAPGTGGAAGHRPQRIAARAMLRLAFKSCLLCSRKSVGPVRAQEHSFKPRTFGGQGLSTYCRPSVATHNICEAIQGWDDLTIGTPPRPYQDQGRVQCR